MEIEWKKIKRTAVGEASEQERQEVETWKEEDWRRESFYENTVSYYREEREVINDLTRKEVEEAWVEVRRRTSRHRFASRRWVGWIAGAAILSGFFFGVRLLVTDPGKEIQGMVKEEKSVRLVLSDGTTRVMTKEKQGKLDIPGFEVNGEEGLKQLEKEQDTIEENREITNSEVIVPRGADYQLTLADGTCVMLNSESRIRFPDKFQTNARKVYLEGEAYFKVAHDERCPFLVETGRLTVRVLGTEFNVKAYEKDRVVATLVSGRVRVMTGVDSLTLVPGEQCEMNGSTGGLTVKEADLVAELAWKNGKFVFKDVTLEDMLEALSRWYDMEVVYESEDLKATRYYIYVERSKTLEEVLDKVALIGKIKYEKHGKKVIIQQQ